MVLCNVIALLSLFICCTSVETVTNNDVEDIHTIMTVRRGVRNTPDNVSVCSSDSEFFSESKATMSCSEATTEAKSCGPSFNIRYECQCKAVMPNYLLESRKCASNADLRQGCSLRFGSWQYSRGWSWNTRYAPLLPLFLDQSGFAMTGSFNVKKTDYGACTLINVTVLNEQGNWDVFAHDPITVKISTYRQMYLINWQTNHVDEETRTKLSGKLLRLFLTCEPVNYGGDYSLLKPLISCLALKATGNTTVEYGKMTSPEPISSSNTTAIAVGVVFALLAVIIGVILAVFMVRRRRATGKNCSLPSHCSLPSLPKLCWRT